MMEKIAQVISYLMHPLLMPVYALIFLFSGTSVFTLTPLATKLFCFLVTGVSMVVLPLISLPIFKRLHLISDYTLDDKQERVYPILVAVIFAFIGFWVLGKFAYTQIVQQLFLAVIILLSVFSIITLVWKMSMHMTAIGGVVGFIFALGIKYPGDMRIPFIIMLLFAGILAASRLYLNKHNPCQIYTGFLFGTLLVSFLLS